MTDYRKLLTILLLNVVAAIVFYVAFAFAEWNLNPGQWEATTRSIFSMLFLTIVVPLSALVAHEMK